MLILFPVFSALGDGSLSSVQVVQNQKGRLIDCMDVLPVGPLQTEKRGQQRNSIEFSMEKCEVLCEEQQPCTVAQAGGPLTGKQLCRKAIWAPTGQ